MAYGQRLRRGVDVAIGVTLGVALGDLWFVLFGAGVWQVVLVCAIAMSLATLVGAGPLITTQAGAQSIAVLVMAPSPVYGFERAVDAAIGCTLALLVATVAPSGPLRKPGEVAAKVVAGMAETLDAAVKALSENDEKAASTVLDRAEAAEKNLVTFDTAAAEASMWSACPLSGAISCPWQPPWPTCMNRLTMPAAICGWLVRRCVVAVWRGDQVPVSYQDLVRRLAEACRFMAEELAERRLPTAARDQLREIGEASALVQLNYSMSTVVILAQTRSIVIDMMQLTGMDYLEARELVPDLD